MAERVIWEREINHERIRIRTSRFQKIFGVSTAVVLAAILILSGARNAIGVLILLGVIGFAWGMTVRFQNLSDAANPRLVVDRGRIILGNRDVIIADIKRYTTVATAIQTSIVSSLGEINLGKVVFRMDVPRPGKAPDLVEFGWPNMAPEEVITLKDALEPVLPGKWVEPEDLIDPDEREEQRDRRRRNRRRAR